MRHWILILLFGLAQGVAAQTLAITIPGKPLQPLDRAALQSLNVIDVAFTSKLKLMVNLMSRPFDTRQCA